MVPSDECYAVWVSNFEAEEEEEGFERVEAAVNEVAWFRVSWIPHNRPEYISYP